MVRIRHDSRLRFVASLLLLALTACSTAYVPRRTSRLALVMDGGRHQLDRNGQRYELGLFGGELEEAVAPNAQAMDHAASFRQQLLSGFVLGIASSIPIGVGVGMTLDDSRRGRDNVLGPSLLLGGLVAYAVGMGLIVGAQPHLYDAINTYNDWVDVGMPADATAAH